LANNIVVVFHLAARVGFWAAIFFCAYAPAPTALWDARANPVFSQDGQGLLGRPVKPDDDDGIGGKGRQTKWAAARGFRGAPQLPGPRRARLGILSTFHTVIYRFATQLCAAHKFFLTLF
jgi:hypothetical protein